MNILVCISHVPDTTSKINFVDDNTQFDKNGVQFVINPNDEFGLTRAIWFKEQQGATITVVNVGKNETEATIRKSLAIGADQAIRIDAEPTDSFFVAKQIAEIVKNGNYDLIITGKESIDNNGATVPGMIATLSEMDFVNSVIDIQIDQKTAKVAREIDGGKEILSVSLPLVIAGQKGIVEEKDLRIPNMRGIMAARTKPINVVAPIETTSRTKSVRFEKPDAKASVKLINADNLDELVDLLHNEAKVI